MISIEILSDIGQYPKQLATLLRKIKITTLIEARA
jgi:hypothetical protein